MANDTYDHATARDGFTPLIQWKAPLPSILPIRYGLAGVNEAVAGHNAHHDHAISHLAYVCLRKLKEIVYNNTTLNGVRFAMLRNISA